MAAGARCGRLGSRTGAKWAMVASKKTAAKCVASSDPISIRNTVANSGPETSVICASSSGPITGRAVQRRGGATAFHNGGSGTASFLHSSRPMPCGGNRASETFLSVSSSG